MHERIFHSGREADFGDAISLRQKVEIGNVAVRHPAAADLWIRLPVDILPAVSRLETGTGFQFLADIAQDRLRGRKAALCFLPRRDTECERVNFGELRPIMIDDGCRKRRNGTGAADDGDAGLPGLFLECGDADDEIPSVGEIDIVNAASETGACDVVATPLERTAGIDDDGGLQR